MRLLLHVLYLSCYDNWDRPAYHNLDKDKRIKGWVDVRYLYT